MTPVVESRHFSLMQPPLDSRLRTSVAASRSFLTFCPCLLVLCLRAGPGHCAFSCLRRCVQGNSLLTGDASGQRTRTVWVFGPMDVHWRIGHSGRSPLQPIITPLAYIFAMESLGSWSATSLCVWRMRALGINLVCSGSGLRGAHTVPVFIRRGCVCLGTATVA
jgi:hypothetical protein